MRPRLLPFRREFLLPIAAAMVVAVATLILWRTLLADERKIVEARTAIFRATAVAELESQLTLRLMTIERLAHRWDIWQNPENPVWRPDAERYLHDFDALEALLWLSPEGTIRWSLTRNEQPPEIEPAALGDLASSTSSIQPLAADRMLAFVAPIPKLGGAAVAIFEARTLLDRSLSANVLRPYGLRVTGSDGQVYLDHGTPDRALASEQPVAVPGPDWTVAAWPAPRTLRELLTPLPQIVLASGLALAFLFALSVYLGQAARRGRQAADRAYDRLRHQTEERQRVAKLLEAILEGTTDVILVKDLEGRYELINNAGARLLNRPVEDVIGRTDAEMMPAETAEEFRRTDRMVLEMGETFTREETGLLDGVERTFLATKGVLRDADGNPLATFGISRDITERVRAREALDAYSRLLSQVIEAQQEIGAAGLDPDRVQTLALRWAETLTGTEGAVVEEMRDSRMVYVAASGIAEPHVGLDLPMEGSLSGRTVSTGEMQLCEDCETDPRVDREACRRIGIGSMLIVPLRYGGEVIGALKVMSSRKAAFGEHAAEMLKLLSGALGAAVAKARAHQESEKAKADLERSNRELEQFAYVASHDLQEPLRMVSSYTQLLERRYADKLDEDAREFIAYAVDGANRMQALIQDLLEFSRVGTRGRPLEPTDMNRSLGRARANLARAIDEAGALVTSDSLPTLMVDEGQVVQLFQNLLANAIKFHGDASPRVHVGASEQEDHWLISVRDSGIGIDPRYAERIFAIFQRLHGKRDYPGTGIGLAVCKRIVERHGGRIWVESAPGEGATFHFTIPKGEGEPS